MKTYFESSVVIASCIDTHENHPQAFHAVAQVVHGEATGVICAHGLAECYSVITGTRAYRQIISPLEVALTLRDNTAGTFEIVALTAEDYLEVIRSSSENGLIGGRMTSCISPPPGNPSATSSTPSTSATSANSPLTSPPASAHPSCLSPLRYHFN